MAQATKKVQPGTISSDLRPESATEDELPADKREEGRERDWERLISIPLITAAWPSDGGPGKGNWGKR